jgi:hypothetical protein
MARGPPFRSRNSNSIRLTPTAIPCFEIPDAKRAATESPTSPAKFFQFIEAGGTSSYVFEQMRELSVRGEVRKLCQYFAAWTADAPRIRKIPVHDVFKCVHQIFFRVHKRAVE